MRRRPLLLVALVAAPAALGACAQSSDEGCPGAVIAALALHGVLDPAQTGCAVPPQDGWGPPAVLPEGQPDGTFEARFTWDDGSGRLAYCSGGAHAAVLYGTRSGDHLRAEATLAGAVLGQCALTCTPLMTVVIEGDLASSSSPPAFTGTLTETFDRSEGECGACVLPCTSTYTITGTGK